MTLTPIPAELKICPNPECQTDLVLGEIPESYGHMFAGKLYYKTTGFYARDMTLFYFCPDCNGAWHRFSPDVDNYPVAAQMMIDEGFIDFTPKT